MKIKLEKDVKKLLIVMAFFFVFMCVLAFIIHYNFHSLYEIGFSEQPIWNTLRGDFMYSVSQQENYFGQHNAPILILLAPIYAMFQQPMTFVVILNLIIVLGALPLYLLSRDLTKSKLMSFSFALSYLLFPSFYYANLRNFRAVMLASTFLIFAFYFIHKKNTLWTYISLGLALSTTELLAPIVFLTGVYMIFKKQKKHGIIIACFALFWLVFSMAYVIPYFNPQNTYVHTGTYKHLGGSNVEIIKNVLIHPVRSLSIGNVDQKMEFVTVIFRQTIFMSFLGPEFILIGTPLFAQNLLAMSQNKYDYLGHYIYPLIALMFVGSVYGVKRILAKTKKKKLVKIISGVLIVTAVFSFFAYGLEPLAKDNCFLSVKYYTKGECYFTLDYIGNAPLERNYVLREAVALIPDDVSVLAQIHTMSHLSTRSETYHFHEFYKCNYADYIIFDEKGTISPVNNGTRYINMQIPEIGYDSIYSEQGVHVLKKTTTEFKCIKR